MLTNEQIKSYKENGYVLVKGFFTTDQTKAAGDWLRSQDQESLARTFTDQEPGVKLAVYQNVHNEESPISKLANDERVLRFASELMEDEAYIWSSKVNLKAAWCGTVEYYHQDYAYWKGRGYDNLEMLTCTIFVDDHSVNNGGLHVIPKTHKIGYIEHNRFININGLSKSMISPEKLTELHSEFGLDAIDAKAGDVLFFSAGLIHGSSHNISPDPRMIILSQMNTKGNVPIAANDKAKEYNLSRARHEVESCEQRLAYYKNKYQKQAGSDLPTFNSPLPKQEKNE